MPWPFSVAEPDYDSGFAAVPASLGALTTDTVRLLGANLANTTAAERTVTITDTAGKVIVQAAIPANQTMPPLEWAFMKAIGLKWEADDVGVVGKLWGYTV